jgi:hypothetical protein
MKSFLARRSRRTLALAVILLVAVASMAALELFPSATYSFDAPYAVTFALSLNATTIFQDQVLKVTMTGSNFLPFPNEPEANFLFPNTLNLSSGVCGEDYPFGLAAFEGHYTLQNLSTSSKVDIFDDFGFASCPIAIGTFRLGPFQSLTREAYLGGYWTAGQTQVPGGGFAVGVLHPFAPGAYTLVIEDAWGHTGLGYFTVAAGPLN